MMRNWRTQLQTLLKGHFQRLDLPTQGQDPTALQT